MIYKNLEIYNVAEIVDNGDGSILWKRVPDADDRAKVWRAFIPEIIKNLICILRSAFFLIFL